MTDRPAPPASDATPAPDVIAEAFMAAVEDLLDLDEREVSALLAREASSSSVLRRPDDEAGSAAP